MRKYHRYTQEQIEYIRKLAETNTVGEIRIAFNAKYKLNVTHKSIKGIMYRNGIKNRLQGYYTRFKKDDEPWNKGKRVFIKGSEKGWFQKGHTDTRKPIGSEHEKNGFITIKIAQPNTWVYKHRHLWEQEYGEIPQDAVIMFKDGNAKNCTIDNLYLTKRTAASAVVRKGIEYTDPMQNVASHKIAELDIAIKNKEKEITT